MARSEEKREEAGEKGEEEKGILGKLKKLFMPEEEKGGEAKAEETRAKETRAGETEVHEVKVSEVEVGKERTGEKTEKPYTYEFYHEIGKKGGEERAREIREEGISLRLMRNSPKPDIRAVKLLRRLMVMSSTRK